jgi:hypothetical protein
MIQGYLNRRTLFILTGALCLALSMGGTYFFLSRPPKTAPTTEAKKPQEWMTVFVHGSFATALGFISMFNVIKDKVHKTNYKKMVSMMRKDPFFYQMQPLHELGLVSIKPSLTCSDENKKYAIFPVTAAYQTMTESIQKQPEVNYFYTYGWSGLISQYRRRKEAIKLYTALVAEYEKIRAQGITPKIRLIAHSHGGNLILNTAGIHELLQKGLDHQPSIERYPDSDELSSLQALHTLLTKPQKDGSTQAVPIAPFTIDEVILLGTPIQPETLPFFLSPFFKKIYNMYSDDDVIQSMDWVSTRRYYSEQRIALSPLSAQQPTIIQIKITLNKPAKESPKKSDSATTTPASSDKALGTIKSTITSLWSRMFGSRPTRQTLDPLHKEFWFMGWKNHDKPELAQQYIKPFPYAILIPHIQKLVSSIPDVHDFDVHLKFKPDAVALSAYLHDTEKKRKKIYINKALLVDLQSQADAWRPHNITPSCEMELLHKYSQMLNS